MSQRWQTPTKFPHSTPLNTISTASRTHLTSNKKQFPLFQSPPPLTSSQTHLTKTLSSISNDNILLLQLLSANSKYNNKNTHWKNKFKLGLVLKQLSLIKDLLNQHTLLIKFWEIIGSYSVLFTFIVLEMILKEKRVKQHAEMLFGNKSKEMEWMRGVDEGKLRKQFWGFVINRVMRKGDQEIKNYQMKIMSKQCKTIRIELDREQEVADIIEEYQDGKMFKEMREIGRSKTEFSRLVWTAWDERF